MSSQTVISQTARYAHCPTLGMIIRTLDEWLVYQKALTAARAVSAIIDRPSFEKDRKLKEQLVASSSKAAETALLCPNRTTDD